MNAECMDISLGVYRCYCPSGYILVDDHYCEGELYTLVFTLTLYMHIKPSTFRVSWRDVWTQLYRKLYMWHRRK